MDTTEKMMKRAARAVLRDELKVLRRQLADAKSAAEPLQRVLSETRQKLLDANASVAVYRQRENLTNQRLKMTLAWADANRSGDYGTRACLEFVQMPTMASIGIGSNNSYLNPFDRWQIKPALQWPT